MMSKGMLDAICVRKMSASRIALLALEASTLSSAMGTSGISATMFPATTILAILRATRSARGSPRPPVT